MIKYTFVVFHADYPRFLEQLHRLGLVHIETIQEQISVQSEKLMRQLHKVQEAVSFLNKKKSTKAPYITNETPFTGGDQLVQHFEALVAKETELKKLKKDLLSQITAIEPWGSLPVNTMQLLQNRQVHFHFYDCNKHDYDPEWKEKFTIEPVNNLNGKVYFLLISDSQTPPALHGAEVLNLPQTNLQALQQKLAEVNTNFEIVHNQYQTLAAYSHILTQYAESIENELAHENALQNTRPEVNGKLMLLQAWAPQKDQQALLSFLNETQTIWVEQPPGKTDNVPILLENNRFSTLFHPIVKLFSLPAYAEIDLTPFFAPFFMLFFGMCLGDVAYGLLIFIALTLLKRKKAYEEMRPLFTLGQFLGVAAIAFGLLTGTVAGIDLSKSNIGFLDGVKGYFVNISNFFNISLLIGLVQILFGMALRVANNLQQKNWRYAMSPLGWMLGIAGGLLYAFSAYTLPAYILLGLGLFCIIWFSDPDAGILKRLGLGLWDLYGITGLFGDVLSYIRLFALGLSSATLGFVVNTIAVSALSMPPVLGEICFLLILIFGHTLNFGVSVLGSFVHPLRLTFVEFYKNAGFTGGGREFNPFKIKNNHHKQSITL